MLACEARLVLSWPPHWRDKYLNLPTVQDRRAELKAEIDRQRAARAT